MVPYDNPPNSALSFFGLVSKREYVSLTDKGYRAAQKAKSASTARTAKGPRVTISGGQFSHSQIGIGGQVIQSFSETRSNEPVFMDLRGAIERSSIDAGDRANLLAAIEAMQKTHNTPGFTDRYKDFMALAANHMAIISPIVLALTGLLGGSHP
jgi:hypothetical protein